MGPRSSTFCSRVYKQIDCHLLLSLQVTTSENYSGGWMCIYVFIWVCALVWGWMHVHLFVEVRDQHRTSSLTILTYLLRQHLALNLELTDVGRLVCQQALGICLCLPSTGIKGMQHWPVFLNGWGKIGLSSFCFDYYVSLSSYGTCLLMLIYIQWW